MGKGKINATRYEDIPTFPREAQDQNIVNVVIETPKGSCHKYALKASYGIIAFHEVLAEGLEWPYDYGFIPQTLGSDGDPLDALVLTERGLFSGCFIQARLLGAIRQKKDGTENDRFLAVPQPSPGAPQASDAYHTLSDVPHEEVRRITEFLIKYSADQGHDIKVTDFIEARDAIKLLKRGMKTFKKHRDS